MFTIVTALASFGLLAVAMRQLPLGTAYAVWTGIGAVGAFVFGIVMMGEALTVARVASCADRRAIGLKLSSAATTAPGCAAPAAALRNCAGRPSSLSNGTHSGLNTVVLLAARGAGRHAARQSVRPDPINRQIARKVQGEGHDRSHFARRAAWASGLLYLTVLIAGVLARFGWLHLPDTLAVLMSPWVIGAAAVLAVTEFLADKIPAFDSLWDAVHTFIRIPAGAVLAAGALGHADPTVLAVAAAGGSLAGARTWRRPARAR